MQVGRGVAGRAEAAGWGRGRWQEARRGSTGARTTVAGEGGDLRERRRGFTCIVGKSWAPRFFKFVVSVLVLGFVLFFAFIREMA